MNSGEFIRIGKDSAVAVLMIHGICGTPRHFDLLIPLIPEDWTVYNILLDGHGKGVAEFGATSMKKWKNQVEQVLTELLRTHQRVFIVGHSMGSLFAIDWGIRLPDRVAGLFLMAVPLRISVSLRAVISSAKLARGRVDPGDRTARAMREDCSVRLEPGMWKYRTWIPRYWELLREIRRTRKQLPRLTVPAMAFQSDEDELVSTRACDLLAGNPHIWVCRLHRSGHFCYTQDDKVILTEQFRQWLESLRR